MEITGVDFIDAGIWFLLLCIAIGFVSMVSKAVSFLIEERKKEKAQRLKEYEREQEQRRKERERWDRQQEKERQARARKRAMDEKKRELERKRVQQEKERQARIAALPEQRRFIAEQRRLMTDSLRYDVMRRDGFRCQLCGAMAKDGVQLHVDHILPVSKGGKTELSNLRTLCERCNMGKRDKLETPMCEDVKAQIAAAPESLSRNAQDQARPDFYDSTLKRLKDARLEYVDKSGEGGSLYFFDEQLGTELKRMGYPVHFAPNGSKSTGHRPAWYIARK